MRKSSIVAFSVHLARATTSVPADVVVDTALALMRLSRMRSRATTAQDIETATLEAARRLEALGLPMRVTWNSRGGLAIVTGERIGGSAPQVLDIPGPDGD